MDVAVLCEARRLMLQRLLRSPFFLSHPRIPELHQWLLDTYERLDPTGDALATDVAAVVEARGRAAASMAMVREAMPPTP